MYRLCNANRLLDLGAQFANLDPAFIVESLVRQVTISQDGANKQTLNDAMTLLQLKDLSSFEGQNLWELGKSIGRLAKAMFDFNINN